MKPKNNFKTFGNFFKSAIRAEFKDLKKDKHLHPELNEERFNEVKEHVLEQYNGLKIKHSFITHNGVIWDCVPIEEQPTLKKYNLSLANAVDLDVPEDHLSRIHNPNLIPSNYMHTEKDAFGNSIFCPEGSIPVKRLKIEDMVKHGSLSSFLNTGKSKRQALPMVDFSNSEEDTSSPSKYAFFHQTVDNIGGHSFLNLWQPPVTDGQNFSLSQQWYTGGTGAQEQVIEVGWQVFPTRYTFNAPCLFIHWTPDFYQTGCYNMDGPGFVQVNNNWALGHPLSPVSTYSGYQYDIEMAWKKIGNNWWLYINGLNAANAVGYYPATIFGSGQLSTKATAFGFGGEVSSEISSYPPMGSGHPASEGNGKAAYQRNIYGFTDTGIIDTLVPVIRQDDQYSFLLGKGGAWDNYFYFGGPGN